MSYSVIVSDNFTRANTAAGTVTGPATYNSPSMGAAYVDYKGSTWEISSNTLVATGLAAGDYSHAYLLRPTSENMLNGQVSVTAVPGTGGAAMAAIAREQNGYAYAVFFYSGTAILCYVGSTAGAYHVITTFASTSGINAANPVTLTIACQGASPTALTATIAQGSTSYTVNASDSTAGLQTAGQWGLSANSSNSTQPVFSALTISQAVVAAAAANITASPTSASFAAGTSQTFNVGVDGYLASGETLTVALATTIGSLSPSTVTFTGDGATQPAAQTVTLSTTAAGNGSVTGTHSESGGSQNLNDFLSIPVAVTTAALSIGTLTAIPSNTGVTLSLSSALAGGSGTGYGYAIYRGTDPNFTANSSSLLTNVGSLPYTDSSASTGVEYFYGVVGSDNAAHLVNSNPAGLGAWTPTYIPYVAAELQTQPLAIVFDGDSITNGQGVTNYGTVNVPTVPGFCIQKLKRLGGIRNISGSNQGYGGKQLADFQPGGTYYNASKAAMQALLTASPTALPVFSTMLGTNDTAVGTTPSAYSSLLQTYISQKLADFPGCKLIIHMSPYYTPNTHNAGTYEQPGLSLLFAYRTVIRSVVASYASSNAGQVFVGDTYAFQYFAQNYQAELQPDTSGPNGTFFLHPSGTAGSNGLIGTQTLGEMHAQAIAAGLYAPVPSPGRSFSFS